MKEDKVKKAIDESKEKIRLMQLHSPLVILKIVWITTAIAFIAYKAIL